MPNIKLNLKETDGIIKHVNAVNNGPAGSKVRNFSSFPLYEALEIPYARNHDAAFFNGYGGEHTVDVHRIFKNFDADVEDPNAYVFSPTDRYIADTESVGTKTFYRLGAAIEHGYKFGTYPPKDYLKWAKICEHIIMHYTEGWANGFNYDIEYWEIWNEPDCLNHDGTSPTWQGTYEEFNKFYCTVGLYLKERFPHLKFGGPAFTSSWKTDFKMSFLKSVKESGAPLDFYSFHGYIQTPEQIIELSDAAVECLFEAGFSKDTELIFNEWNYIRGWLGDEYMYSMKAINGLKGASFDIGVMCAGQASDMDMLMYYEGRPCMFCGLFDSYYEPQKPYYAFLMFKDVKNLGKWVKSDYGKDGIYYCAATNNKESAIILTNYSDVDDTPAKEVTLKIENINNCKKIEYYLLDETHDNELVKTEEITSTTAEIKLNIDLFSTFLIKIV